MASLVLDDEEKFMSSRGVKCEFTIPRMTSKNTANRSPGSNLSFKTKQLKGKASKNLKLQLLQYPVNCFVGTKSRQNHF
eukprot:scaffold732_cov265-Alexandrium_tamarense.AAC.1